MAQIPDIRLNDGRTMPQIGLGVMQMPADETEALCLGAIEVGYRAIDAAPGYKNEAGVGAALRASPVPVMVTTKLWNTNQGMELGRRAFEASLATLGRIDLYLIHWPAPSRGQFVESWKALVRLREEGRTRSIGVSNFRPDDLRRVADATGVVPAVNQIELHPRFQQSALRAAHAELGVVTECWSPLGQGSLLQDPVIARLAAKHGKSPAQVVIRWHLDNGCMVIPKTVRAERLRENLAVFDFKLDADDMAAIATLDTPDGRLGGHPDEVN